MTTEQRIAQIEEQIAVLRAAIENTTSPLNYATSKYSLEEMDALLDYVASIKPAV